MKKHEAFEMAITKKNKHRFFTCAKKYSQLCKFKDKNYSFGIIP